MNFTVAGMSCDHCVRAITNAVRKLDANASVDVDLTASSVSVKSKKADVAAVKAALIDAGYDVTSQTA